MMLPPGLQPAIPPLATSGLAPYFFDWLAHPSYDDYWRQWSIDTDYSRLTLPALHGGSWYDIFLQGTIANFSGMQQSAGDERARQAQKLLIGP